MVSGSFEMQDFVMMKMAYTTIGLSRDGGTIFLNFTELWYELSV